MDVGGMLRTEVLSMAGVREVEEKAIGVGLPKLMAYKEVL